MEAFYDRLERLRDMLAEAGLATWSRELLVAERSASTSGEAISNTSVVLRKLRDSDAISNLELREEVEGILDQGRQIWNRSQG